MASREALPKYDRTNLPQDECDDGYFLAGAGLETFMIYEKGFKLPHFASFALLRAEEGISHLHDYWNAHLMAASDNSKCSGIILDTPTWRTSEDWVKKMDLSSNDIVHLNRRAGREAKFFRDQNKNKIIVIAGEMGPRSDGYKVDNEMGSEEAEEYHALQAKALSEAGVDFLSASTLTYPNEAIGIANIAEKLMIPVSISFTLEENGCLPNGISLKDAIQQVDDATCRYPVYYGINCSHPEHFMHLFKSAKEPWMTRIQLVRCNPSKLSHEELDQSDSLHPGDPVEFGKLNGQLKKLLPGLKVFGGCCGTNEKHLKEICKTLDSIL